MTEKETSEQEECDCEYCRPELYYWDVHRTLGQINYDAEIERLKAQVKAAFFRGSDFSSSYHGNQTPFDLIEEAFSEFLKN